MMRRVMVLLALALAAAGCAAPGSGSGGDAPALGDAGRTLAGEECSFRRVGTGAQPRVEVICGTWTAPSARLFALPGRQDPMAAATGAGFEDYLAAVAQCEPPRPARVLGDVPAAVRECRRRGGGVPHLALVAAIDGDTWFADGVTTALPAIEATLATLTGRREAGTVAAAGAEGTRALALQLRGDFGSGDVGRYDGLMLLGSRQNIDQDFAGAEASFRDALALHGRLFGADSPDRADAMAHLALQLSNLGRFEEADALFATAAEIAPAASDPQLPARVAHYRAYHARNRGRPEEAARFLAEAERRYLAAAPNLERTLRRIDVAAELPGSAPVLGPNPRDLRAFIPLSLVRDAESELAAQGIADLWRLRGILAYEAGDCAGAQREAVRSAGLLSRIGVDPGGVRHRALRVAGLAAECERRYAAAASDLGEAVSGLAAKLPGTAPEVITRFEFGGALLNVAGAGSREQALSAFRAAARTLRERRRSATAAAIAPYLDLLVPEAGAPARADEIAEALEASFLVSGGAAAAAAADAAALLAGEGSAIRELREARNARDQAEARFDRAVAAGVSEAERTAIRAQIEAAQRRLAEAEARVQAERPEFALLSDTMIAPAELQATLRPDEALLSIVQGPARAYGFLITRDRLAAWRIPLSEREAQESVRRLRAGLTPDPATGRLAPFDVAEAHRLWQRLVPSRAPDVLAYRRLVIATTGPLASLPFAVLVTETPRPIASDADYRAVAWLLAGGRTLAYAPSALAFAAQRRLARPSSAPLPYVGFAGFTPLSPARAAQAIGPSRRGCEADVSALAALPPLPAAAREVEISARQLRAGPEAVRAGAAFTRSAVIGADLTRYRVVHFAAHAVLSDEVPCLGEPAILTAAPPGSDPKEAVIRLSDVLRTRLDADLVVLSACNTAGPDGRGAGEAFSGLTRGMLYAGARSLLATHWTVPDFPIAAIAALTLSRVARGEEPAEALSEAQREFLSRADDGNLPAAYAHPFNWAAPVVIGGQQTPAQQARR
jgi:CHAT domain-containing protein